MTRQEIDHARYMAQREERLKKQRAYYRSLKEECKRRRDERLRLLIMKL